MKKVIPLLTSGALLLSSGLVAAHEGTPVPQKSEKAPVNTPVKIGNSAKVLVNGVGVKSKANHAEGDKYYVSVEAFTDLFDRPVSWSADKKSVTFNGKTIATKTVNGEQTAWIKELSDAVNGRITVDGASQEIYVLVLPEGTINLSPGEIVPAMGEHWAKPDEMPLGPIYGVLNGRLVFLEYMISQQDFVNGKSYRNIPGMKGLPSPTVVQTDIEHQPVGHPGFEIPHFDIHNYFITDEEQMSIGTVKVDLLNDKSEKIGYAAFYNLGPQTFVQVVASGLTPNSKHGFHIHENPISNGDLASAGGHFNPDGKQHGHDNPAGAHLGDMQNLVVDQNGNVEALIPVPGVTLEEGKPNSIYGKSLIIHASEDDGKTDPSGNSGARIAGGNIPE